MNKSFSIFSVLKSILLFAFLFFGNYTNAQVIPNGDFELGVDDMCAWPTGFNCTNDAGRVVDGIHPLYTALVHGCTEFDTNYTHYAGAHSGTGYVYFFASLDKVISPDVYFPNDVEVEISVWYAGPQIPWLNGQNSAQAFFRFGIDGAAVGPNVFVPSGTEWTRHCYTTIISAGNHDIKILSGQAANYVMWFDDFSISVTPLSTYSLGNDTAVCQGEQLTLDATHEDATYLWQDNSTNPTFDVTQAGTYWVEIINACATRTDTIVIDYYPSANIDFGNDTTFCEGETFLLDASTTNATYLWQDNSTNSTFNINQQGMYWVELTDTNNCSFTDSININYNPLPIFSLGDDSTMCDSVNLILDASTTNATYLWQDNSTNPTFMANQQGIHWAMVTVDNCSSIDSIDLAFAMSPILNLNDTTLCEGQTIILDVTTNNVTYLWQDNSTSPIYSVSNSGLYWVELTDTNNCIALDSLVVTDNPLSTFGLGSDTLLCDGDTLFLDVTAENVTYLWQDNSINPNFDVTQTGIYWVEATNVCGIERDSIDVVYNPYPNVNLGNDTTLCQGDTIFLDATYSSSDYLWQDNSVAPTYSVTQTGAYWVEVSLENCSLSDSVNIDFNPLPIVDLGNDTTLCDREGIKLDVTTTDGTYLWHNDSISPIFNIAEAGVFWVEVSVDNCSSIDSIIINYNPLPIVNLGNDTLLCDGESLLLDASCLNANYLWQDNSVNPTYNVTEIGFYSVELEENNCIGYDQIFVDYIPLLQVNLGNDTSLCFGDSLSLDVASLYYAEYLWQDNSTSSNFNITEAGAFWVEVTNSCEATGDTINIVYNSLPIVNLGADTNICDGESLVLTTNYSNATYQWQDNSTDSIFIVQQAGLYWLEVEQNSCKATDSINILYKALPIVNLGNDKKLCSNETLILNASSNGAQYLWQDNSTDSIFEINQSGLYWVEVEVDNCKAKDSIMAYYYTVPAFSLGQDTIICLGETILLDANSSDADYLWQDNSTYSNYNVTEEGLYWVDVSNYCGNAVDSISINYADCSCVLQMPDAFSPDGDGLNDSFKPIFNCNIVEYEFSIYNRWGEKLFTSTNSDTSWDGYYQGSVSEIGVYVYTVIYKFENHKQETKNGSFSLIK